MALKWFRRSKPPEPPSPPADLRPAPHTQPQERTPLRIRGLLLLNLQPSDGTGQIENAPPLGSRDEVIRAIDAVAPGIRFNSQGHGELRGDDHLLAIDLGPDDPVHAAVASAEGDAGLELLRSLMLQRRWRAYAAKAGVFIEPDALDLFALPDTSPTSPRW
jgi:hypothetical protein